MKKNFIPGIYNYCDRWCERCIFSNRCRNYESTGKLSAEQTDIDNKAFWDTISNNFQEAIALLQKSAEKYGIDINQPMTKEEEAAYQEKRRLVKYTLGKQPLTSLCKQYQKIVLPFLKTSEGMVDKTRELVAQLHLGIKPEEEVVHTVAGMGDCFEIIQWYVFFIDAKLQRALQGSMEDADDNDGYPKDSDGSVKIAIIAIEKSMAAWARLYELMPEAEDSAFNALSLLSQLKQKALEEFPSAMQFKRPGFDD